MSQKLVRIDSGYFIAVIILKDDIVIEAAPIVKYMIGWDSQKLYQQKRLESFDL